MPNLPDQATPVPVRTVATRPGLRPPGMVYFVRGRPGPGDRPPLPSGHPETWGRITAGTCTDGTPYPFPVFMP